MFVRIGGTQPVLELDGDRPAHIGTPSRRAGVRVSTACGPRGDASLKRLNTDFHNARAARLDQADRALNWLVSHADGFGGDFIAGNLSDDWGHYRLFQLNRERDGK
jgi:hypothetical protein